MKRQNEKLIENKTFFDGWASSYDAALFQFWMRRFYQPLIKIFNDHNSVLDVSCGTGEFLREVSKKTNARLEGMDYSQKMVEVAKRKLGSSANIKQGDVHHLPYNDNTFEYVISTEAFHHYYNQEKALMEMKRVAKKNGKVIVVDVNFFWRTINYLFERFEPGCVKINSKKELYSLFKQAGLQEIKQRRSFIFSIYTEGVKQ